MRSKLQTSIMNPIVIYNIHAVLVDCKENPREEESSSRNHYIVWKDIGGRNFDIDDEDNYLSEIIDLFYHI